MFILKNAPYHAKDCTKGVTNIDFFKYTVKDEIHNPKSLILDKTRKFSYFYENWQYYAKQDMPKKHIKVGNKNRLQKFRQKWNAHPQKSEYW